eukprot:scaffold90572_cov17-Tisochrysis_lutea.AAC.3
MGVLCSLMQSLWMRALCTSNAKFVERQGGLVCELPDATAMEHELMKECTEELAAPQHGKECMLHNSSLDGPFREQPQEGGNFTSRLNGCRPQHVRWLSSDLGLQGLAAGAICFAHLALCWSRHQHSDVNSVS